MDVLALYLIFVAAIVQTTVVDLSKSDGESFLFIVLGEFDWLENIEDKIWYIYNVSLRLSMIWYDGCSSRGCCLG